jgi:SPOR domain
MSSAAQSQELDSPPVASRPAHKTRGLFVSFVSLVILGLGLAGWYVSTRIMAAEPQPAEHIQTVAAAPAPQVLLPLSLEYYLQIAALGIEQDALFLRQLQDKGYRAHYEAAARGHEARILVGPYPDATAMNHARARLIDSGILATEYVR